MSKKNKNNRDEKIATETPPVIALPDGTVDQAQAVMADAPAGPTSAVPSESEDLLEAATMGATSITPTALTDDEDVVDDAPLVGSPIEDAEFTESDQSADDPTNNTQAAPEKTDADVVANTAPVEDTPPEVKISEWCLTNLRDGWSKFTDLCRKLWTETKIAANQMADDAEQWSKKKIAEYYEWRAAVSLTKPPSRSEMRYMMGELRTLIISQGNETRTALNRTNARLDKIEKSISATNRAINRQKIGEGQINAEDLATLLEALAKGHKIKAADMASKITGITLKDARELISLH